ncbi:MAG: hypothetical protein H7A38_00825 [Chlamydiales bacterium]|nr:hypothetical protein [Chlamydiales bacterium]
MSGLLKILPTLSADQIRKIADSYTQDVVKHESNAHWFHVATLVSVVIATVGYHTSQPVEEKDPKASSWTNRFLRTCFVWGGIATAYCFAKHILAHSKMDHAIEMRRFCVELLSDQ